MAKNVRKIEEILSLSAETPKVLSYADYYAKTPLFTSLRIENSGEVALENITLALENEN